MSGEFSVISRALDNAFDLCANVEALISSALGCEPVKGEPCSKTPRQGCIGSLTDRAEALEDSLAKARSDLLRLDVALHGGQISDVNAVPVPQSLRVGPGW